MIKIKYEFPNALLVILANRQVREIPKFCPMISIRRTREYAADALRQLRIFKKKGGLKCHTYTK